MYTFLIFHNLANTAFPVPRKRMISAEKKDPLIVIRMQFLEALSLARTDALARVMQGYIMPIGTFDCNECSCSDICTKKLDKMGTSQMISYYDSVLLISKTISCRSGKKVEMLAIGEQKKTL